MKHWGETPTLFGDCMDLKGIASVIAAVVIVACVTIPIIENTAVDSIEYSDPGWQYDDYEIIANVASVSGALEVVTLDGTNYVHAKNVGTGTITYQNGTTENVTVEKANLDVIVALGQSNNAYANVDPSAATCPAIGTSYYYGTSSYPILGSSSDTVGDMQPMVTTPGTSVIGDKAPPFCAEYYAHSYHKVYYINSSWAGTSITTWQPGSTSFDAAAANIENALSVVDTDLFELTPRGYTWIQGEQDSAMSTEDYYDYFVAMNNAILAGGLGIDLDHCFISKVPNTFASASNAQMLLAKRLSSVTMATEIADTFTISNGLLGDDGLHYTQAGDNLIGYDLGYSASHYYYPDYDENSASNQILGILPILIVIALILAVLTIGYTRKEGY